MREEVYTCDLCGTKSSNSTREFKGVELAPSPYPSDDTLPVVVALGVIEYKGVPMPACSKHLCEPCIMSIARLRGL